MSLMNSKVGPVFVAFDPVPAVIAQYYSQRVTCFGAGNFMLINASIQPVEGWTVLGLVRLSCSPELSMLDLLYPALHFTLVDHCVNLWLDIPFSLKT